MGAAQGRRSRPQSAETNVCRVQTAEGITLPSYRPRFSQRHGKRESAYLIVVRHERGCQAPARRDGRAGRPGAAGLEHQAGNHLRGAHIQIVDAILRQRCDQRQWSTSSWDWPGHHKTCDAYERLEPGVSDVQHIQ